MTAGRKGQLQFEQPALAASRPGAHLLLLLPVFSIGFVRSPLARSRSMWMGRHVPFTPVDTSLLRMRQQITTTTMTTWEKGKHYDTSEHERGPLDRRVRQIQRRVEHICVCVRLRVCVFECLERGRRRSCCCCCNMEKGKSVSGRYTYAQSRCRRDRCFVCSSSWCWHIALTAAITKSYLYIITQILTVETTRIRRDNYANI